MLQPTAAPGLSGHEEVVLSAAWAAPDVEKHQTPALPAPVATLSRLKKGLPPRERQLPQYLANLMSQLRPVHIQTWLRLATDACSAPMVALRASRAIKALRTDHLNLNLQLHQRVQELRLNKKALKVVRVLLLRAVWDLRVAKAARVLKAAQTAQDLLLLRPDPHQRLVKWVLKVK